MMLRNLARGVIVLSEISPELLGVDIARMRKHCSDVGVRKEYYRDVVEMFNEGSNACERTGN